MFSSCIRLASSSDAQRDAGDNRGASAVLEEPRTPRGGGPSLALGGTCGKLMPQPSDDKEWWGAADSDSDDLGVGSSCLAFDVVDRIEELPLFPRRGIAREALAKFEDILQRQPCWWRATPTAASARALRTFVKVLNHMLGKD